MIVGPFTVADLPAPPPGRAGFPWTQGTTPRTVVDGATLPTISVVTPSYNQGQYLEETIRSVLLQGYPKLEYVVMDGGSTDESVDILRKYAPFLSGWTSARDEGQADAINRGFEQTTGELMGWLNSDDILLDGALFTIADAFRDPTVEIATGLRKVIDEDSRVTANWIRDIPTKYYITHYCPIAQETTYWRRTLWQRLGPLDTSLHFAMDYDFWLRAVLQGDCTFHLMPHYTGGFRDYPNNKSNSWQDTYQRDMTVLYRRYDMGASEVEIHHRLGRRWARRYDLYSALGEQKWTDAPRNVMRLWRIMENPLLCDLIISGAGILHQYRYDRLTHGKSRLAALRAALAHEYAYLTSRRDADSISVAGSGDVRQVEYVTGPETTLSWGDGWHPLESDQHSYFRWSAGESQVRISDHRKPVSLQFSITAALQDAGNTLTILDEAGFIVEQYPIPGQSATHRLTLYPDQTPTTLRFVWHGKAIEPSGRDTRRLTFRIMALGLDNISDALARLDEHITAVDNMPTSGLRDSGKMMRMQAALMTDLAASQTQITARLSELAHRRSRRPRLLIDASTYQIKNNGDIAMFQTLVRRVWARFPNAYIRIITNDPLGLHQKIDPRIQPIEVGNRAAWDQLAQLRWTRAFDDCDAVLLTGGGYFTDAFAEHAMHMLHTLQAGQQHGLPTFIVGCGFEPVEHAGLEKLAQAVLPYVTAITCREALTSPGVLRHYGVDDARFTVTGDDAIELAYSQRPETIGQALGINLRNHAYNIVEAGQFEAVRGVLRAFMKAHQAPLVPAPISNYTPGDAEAIRELLRGIDNASSGGRELDSPETLLPRIASCRVMLTGSYHTAVFALSMGIPAICLTRSSHYQHKMTGLLDMFASDVAGRVISLDDPALADKLTTALASAWENAPHERAALLEKARKQITLGENAYARMFDIIDDATR